MRSRLMEPNGTIRTATVTVITHTAIKAIGSPTIRTAGKILTETVTPMKMMRSSTMVHNGTIPTAMATVMKQTETVLMPFQVTRLNGKTLMAMAMETTAMHSR